MNMYDFTHYDVRIIVYDIQTRRNRIIHLLNNKDNHICFPNESGNNKHKFFNFFITYK